MAKCAVIYSLIVLGACQKGLTSLIQTHQTVMAAVGQEAQFSCLLTESGEVYQVTWQKVLPDYDKNLTTCNNMSQTLDPDFRDEVEFRGVGLQNSSIAIRNVTDEDEGCYRCVFDTYDEGFLSATTCLQLYELHEPVLHVRESNSPEESVVSCSVTARPAPTVTLTVTQQHLYFYNSSTVTVVNSNNTVTVSTVVVLSGLRGDGTQVGCAVRVGSGPQKEVFLTMTEVKQTPDVFVRKSRSSDQQNKYLLSCGCLAAVVVVLLILRHRKSLSKKMKMNTTKTEEPPPETELRLIKQKNHNKKQTKFEEIQQSKSPNSSETDDVGDVAADEATV